YRYCTGKSPKCYIYYVTTSNEWDHELINNICSSSERDINSTVTDIKEVEIKVLGKDYVIEAYNEVKNSISVQINLKNCITLEK
ncbi:hypothetical protein HMPREF9094_2511, partial [Fusobacterium animalis ATCC 51191]